MKVNLWKKQIAIQLTNKIKKLKDIVLKKQIHRYRGQTGGC